MKIIYEAYDGTRFDDEDDCRWYEEKRNHKDIYLIRFFDANGNEYHITSDYDSNENIYQCCEKIVIDNKSQADDLLWISEEYGWCEFEQIISPGTWIRTEDEMRNGVWKKLESN